MRATSTLVGGNSVGELSFGDLRLPASVILGVVAAGVYMVSCFRGRRSGFGLTDALIVACITAIVAGMAMPLFGAAQSASQETALKTNLQTFRAQIELYKTEHGGRAPIVYKASFPQLLNATDAEGYPGRIGKEHPLGPYFRHGLPVNPLTGKSTVVPVEKFPLAEPTGSGGWLYHPATGRIAPDVAGHLDD